jgi:Ca2+/Na+ antiporter
MNFPQDMPILSCEQVYLLPNTQQCQFVKEQCSDYPGFINSFTLYYCLAQSETTRHWIGIPLLIVILLVLFASIGLVAGNCLVPNLNAITSHLKIPENISGLTLLAFANGSPDIISTYTSFKTGNTMLALGELIGAAYFINSVVIGTIFLIRPFDLVPSTGNAADDQSQEHKLSKLNAKGTYLRDVCFFILAGLFLLYCVKDGVITRFEMILLVCIYVGYVFLIIVWEFYFKKESKKLKLDTHARNIYSNNNLQPLVIDENVQSKDTYGYNPQVIRNLEFATILSGLTTRRTVGFFIDQSGRGTYSDNDNTENIEINALQAEIIEPPKKSLLQTIFDFIAFPFIKLSRHTIPILTVTDYEGDYKPGLSKLFELLTALVISPFIIIFTLFPEISNSTKFILFILAFGNTYFAYYNLIRSSNPLTLVKCLVSLLGVFASIAWISIIAAEIISILTLISSLTYIRQSALGITVFALGNSIGDLISCIVITKMGYPLMALAACIGGPLLNILIGLGMSGLLVGVDYIEIAASASLVFCILGLLLNLIVVLLIVIPFGGWRCDKYVGLGMIFMWMVGISIAMLLEALLTY